MTPKIHQIYHCVLFSLWKLDVCTSTCHKSALCCCFQLGGGAPCTLIIMTTRNGIHLSSSGSGAARVEPAGSEYVIPIQIYGRWLIHNFVERRLSAWQSVLFHKRHVIHHHLQNVGDIHQKNFPFRKLLGKKAFEKSRFIGKVTTLIGDIKMTSEASSIVKIVQLFYVRIWLKVSCWIGRIFVKFGSIFQGKDHPSQGIRW